MSFPEREKFFLSTSEAKHRHGESKGSELVFGKKDERNYSTLQVVFGGIGGILGVVGLCTQIKTMKGIKSFFGTRKEIREAGYIPPRMPIDVWPLKVFDKFAKQYGYDDYPEMKAAAEERDMTVENLAWGILEKRGVI